MFCNVTLFIFINEIQGKTFVLEEYLVIHTDVLILTFSPLILACVCSPRRVTLSNHNFRYDLE